MVVVQVLGLGVVVVLGPFLDRITASQFCAGSTWSPYCASGGFPITVQRSAKRWSQGCVNAADKARQKW